jgi:phosphoribosyl 1,2-cyclic phosphodiesterase
VRLRVWGCRGSLATPGEGTLRYGGNTSCVEVRLADGSLIVLDAGTGIMPLGLSLLEEGVSEIDLLLTHLHLDHLEGLGFFAPIWEPATRLRIWGPPSPRRGLAERIARYLSPPLFPIELSDIPAQISFHDVPDEPWTIGSATVLADPVVHPGATVGYRLLEDGRSLAYLPDHEPGLGVDLGQVSPDWMSGYALAWGADVLLHDSQFTEEEYPERVGWGHSSIADTVTFAGAAGVTRLVLFHHDPQHTDADLELHLQRALSLAGRGGLALAHEGMEIAV